MTITIGSARLLALVITGAALLMVCRRAKPSVLTSCLLLMLLPGLALAITLPFLAPAPTSFLIAFLQGAAIAPIVLIYLLHRMAHLQPGLRRIAAGLGANARARLRLLWLPRFGWPVTATLLLAIVLIIFLPARP